jgi:hypothetical protein
MRQVLDGLQVTGGLALVGSGGAGQLVKQLTTGGTVTSAALLLSEIPTIPNSQMATMVTNTIKGNNTGSPAAPQDLTVAQVIAMLGLTANIFGQDYQETTALTVSTTALNTFQNKINYTTSALVAGTYKINWYARVRNGSANNQYEVQFLVDGTIYGGVQVFRDSSNVVYNGTLGMFDLALTAGTHVLTLQYRSVGGGTVSINEARASIFRVS